MPKLDKMDETEQLWYLCQDPTYDEVEYLLLSSAFESVRDMAYTMLSRGW